MFNVEQKKTLRRCSNSGKGSIPVLFSMDEPFLGSRERWERWQSGCLLDCVCKEHVRDKGGSGKSAFPSTPTSMADSDKGAC